MGCMTALGHKKENRYTCCRYSVWNAFTDEVVAIDSTAKECARAMKIKEDSFYSTFCRVKDGTNHKWVIERRFVDDKEGEDG